MLNSIPLLVENWVLPVVHFRVTDRRRTWSPNPTDEETKGDVRSNHLSVDSGVLVTSSANSCNTTTSTCEDEDRFLCCHLVRLGFGLLAGC